MCHFIDAFIWRSNLFTLWITIWYFLFFLFSFKLLRRGRVKSGFKLRHKFPQLCESRRNSGQIIKWVILIKNQSCNFWFLIDESRKQLRSFMHQWICKSLSRTSGISPIFTRKTLQVLIKLLWVIILTELLYCDWLKRRGFCYNGSRTGPITESSMDCCYFTNSPGVVTFS